MNHHKPPTLLQALLPWVVVLALLLVDWIVIAERPQCALPAWDTYRVDGITYSDPVAIADLTALVGPSMWPDYEDVGNEFGAATDSNYWFDVRFLQDEQYVARIGVTENEHGVYVWWFSSLDDYADANGEHYGYHPCAVIEAPKNYIELWLEAIQA